MFTLGFAASLSRAQLGFAEGPQAAAAHADRQLEGVYVLQRDGEDEPDHVRHRLVIVQAEDPRLSDLDRLTSLRAHLTRVQAAGLALALPSMDQIAADLRGFARCHGVPLLVVGDDPAAWLRLQHAIDDERNARQARTAAIHRQLLDLTRSIGRPDGAQRLVSWLSTFASAQVTVTSPQGLTLAAAPAGASATIRAAREKISELARAGLGSAALDWQDGQIRLFTVGNSRPSPVLAVAAPAFSRETNTAIARILDLLAVHVAVQDAKQNQERLRIAEEGIRHTVLQLLMTGDVTTAQCAAVSVFPGTLDADDCRVYVLKAPPADHQALAQECHEAIGARALVSCYAALPDKVIIVAPHSSAEECPVLGGLIALTQAAPNRYLGGSRSHHLSETARAFIDATRALVVAQRVPARIHIYRTEAQLAHVLDARADAWARSHLAPLLDRPERREELLGTLRLGLDFTPAAVAGMLNIHRNTVARRLGEAAGLLGVDLQDLGTRAVLGLALEVLERGEPVLPAAAEPVGIKELLDTDEVREWAEQFLKPLEADRRLRTTLAAWIKANTRIKDTAEAISRNAVTVREYLRHAERLLQRRLLTGTSIDADGELDVPGAHDVVLALAVLGAAAVGI